MGTRSTGRGVLGPGAEYRQKELRELPESIREREERNSSP
jgi:hypothetical protein